MIAGELPEDPPRLFRPADRDPFLYPRADLRDGDPRRRLSHRGGEPAERDVDAGPLRDIERLSLEEREVRREAERFLPLRGDRDLRMRAVEPNDRTARIQAAG